MNAVFLLNTGYLIPLLGFGTYQIRGTETIHNVLDIALNAGYRHIDTAIVYRNEADIGNALKTLLPKYNLKREDIFITSKLVPSAKHTEQDVESLVKESLKNLQTDYIDLYLIHWPGASGLQPTDARNKIQRQLTWKVLTNLKKQGLLRSAGVSNFEVRHLQEFVDDPNFETPAVNQVEWHPRNHNSSLLDYCRQKGIFLQAYSSLGTSGSSSLREDPTVHKIAQKLGKTSVQVLLRWAYQQNIGILPKASSKAHIEENIDLDFVIPDEDMKILSELKTKEKFAWDPQTVA
ncbi:hypothetical protein PVAND_012637 [Polypedilum vanderplanki]|uniref:NADP-dependent oxidoreductase domain-containing protein n=1 Tax=Polypedilum vanderplanki TaxID=319348 RepID=A0A9J6CNA8_POLVA|nr:hypothetical protein PVAND_012637 [Polypedilum vanderplanki]